MGIFERREPVHDPEGRLSLGRLAQPFGPAVVTSDGVGRGDIHGENLVVLHAVEPRAGENVHSSQAFSVVRLLQPGNRGVLATLGYHGLQRICQR